MKNIKKNQKTKRFQKSMQVASLIVLFMLVALTKTNAITRYVSTSGTWGSNTPCYSTISAAILSASNGDEIIVNSGTYANAFTINKNLTIRGANAGTHGSATRVAESIIKDVVITISGSSVVVLDGFHIYHTTNTVGAKISVGNTPTTIQNCIIERVSTTAGVNAYGIQTTGGSTEAIIIQRNLFTGSLAGSLFSAHKTWNSGVYSNGGSNITITNNTLQNCRTAINSDNHSSGVTISNNTFSNNGTHIAFGGSGSTSGSHTLSGNTFSVTSGLSTINLSNVTASFRLDLTDNTFGTTAASSLSISQCFDVENTMVHKGASSKNGLITIQTGKLFKTSTTTFTNNILYATAGDAIYVSSGSYTEDVVVNKSVKIYGNNYNINPNDGSWNYNSSRNPESIYTTTSAQGFKLTANDIEIKGFKFTGISNSRNAIGNAATSTMYSNWTIENNWFASNTDANFINMIGAGSSKVFENVIIKNNRFENNAGSSKTNIAVYRCGALSITGNYISGLYYGIYADGFGDGVISNNNIKNVSLAGIQLATGNSSTQYFAVENNTFSGCQSSIRATTQASNPYIKLLIKNNTISVDASKLDASWAAMQLAGINNNLTTPNIIEGNSITISGALGTSPFGETIGSGAATGAHGITLAGNVGFTKVINNSINASGVTGLPTSAPVAGNDMNGIILRNYSYSSNPAQTEFSGNVLIQSNNIEGFKNSVLVWNPSFSVLSSLPPNGNANATITENRLLPTTNGYAILSASGGSLISATCNWYGSTTYADVASKIAGNVTFVSFLVSGTDNDLATSGFQPAS
ncbi:MAG: right-handed parallel beta-helix repeat-containing protein, partial [Bacteroidota bacterium]